MKRLILVLLILWPGLAFGADYYTAATARTQIRSILNEATASFWSDTEIDNWVKEATEDISVRTGCIQISDTVTLSTGTYEYATTTGSVSAADIVDILGMVYVVSTDIIGNTTQRFIGLIPISPSVVSQLPLTDSGPPQYYYRAGDKIGVLPVPTATENAQVVRLYFTKQSQTIGDLPNEYQPLTFWYAASMAYKKEHRYVESDKFYQMYLEKLNTISRVKSAPKEVAK